MDGVAFKYSFFVLRWMVLNDVLSFGKDAYYQFGSGSENP